MGFLHSEPPRIMALDSAVFTSADLSVSVLRLDEIHPVISGNKWFKLKHHFTEARSSGATGLISFGGPWSNHLLALACLAKEENFPVIGIIRGEEWMKCDGDLITAHSGSTDPMQRLGRYGMRTEAVPRGTYRRKKEPDFLRRLAARFPGYAIIPEGGAGELGIKGCEEMLDESTLPYTHICCAAGTGTMFSGLVNAAAAHQSVVGVCVLKGLSGWHPASAAGIRDKANLARAAMLHDHHAGGYAKTSGILFHFMNRLYADTGIPTDIVYTAKLFMAVENLGRAGYFPRGSRVLIVHSGGLAGNASIPRGTIAF